MNNIFQCKGSRHLDFKINRLYIICKALPLLISSVDKQNMLTNMKFRYIKFTKRQQNQSLHFLEKSVKDHMTINSSRRFDLSNRLCMKINKSQIKTYS